MGQGQSLARGAPVPEWQAPSQVPHTEWRGLQNPCSHSRRTSCRVFPVWPGSPGRGTVGGLDSSVPPLLQPLCLCRGDPSHFLAWVAGGQSLLHFIQWDRWRLGCTHWAQCAVLTPSQPSALIP